MVRQSLPAAAFGIRTVVTAVASAACVLPLAGCLINGHSSNSLSGDYVGPATFSQIEPGTTTGAWVLAVLGEPTRRSSLDDGSEIWAWSYSERKSSSGSVFLLLDSSNEREKVGAAYVQVRDGVVVKAWRD
jgi:hypothetical protein